MSGQHPALGQRQTSNGLDAVTFRSTAAFCLGREKQRSQIVIYTTKYKMYAKYNRNMAHIKELTVSDIP